MMFGLANHLHSFHHPNWNQLFSTSSKTDIRTSTAKVLKTKSWRGGEGRHTRRVRGVEEETGKIELLIGKEVESHDKTSPGAVGLVAVNLNRSIGIKKWERYPS
jgi:hypothetical protein